MALQDIWRISTGLRAVPASSLSVANSSVSDERAPMASQVRPVVLECSSGCLPRLKHLPSQRSSFVGLALFYCSLRLGLLGPGLTAR